MNFYFDLHCHPGTKPYLSGLHLEDKDDCWKVYENPLVKITCSQSAYTQLDNGNVKLAVVPIYVMEKEFTQTFLIEHIAPTLTLLDAKMLGEVQIGDGLDHLFGEIQILENSLSQNADDTPKAQFLTTMDKFDSGKINIVLAIEGAQGFVNGPNSMVENLTMLKNHPKYRFLYLTLIHATRNYCGTHAYAIKMLKGTNKFKPGGEGLTDLGKELIDLAYDEEKGKRILIDIKHMSLVSRLDFYNYRAEQGHHNIPIMATHMGFTGISMKARSILDTISGKIARKGDEIMVEYDRPRGFGEGGNVFNKKKTHFNPWSINLYNEEIPIILNSGGLIGINMDQRILGTKPVTGEYFSKEDFNRILGLRSEDDLSELEDPQKEFIEEPGPETDVKPLRINRKFHLRHVSNAILHVVKQMIIDAEQQGEDPEAAAEKAWKQVVIGSDFDGLIDPVNNCIDCTEFGMMEQELPEMMQEMIEDAQEKAKEDGLELNFFQGDLKERIRDIMFNNGFAFMKKHF